mmetsp:Transcript_25333/g.63362  ORF Transcript_25333/g.63362 Transcript_25333/m.63362 type:complete len:111 (+) Transcript_25333:180-512(+)|eukprot:CAMPEP_0184713650 /NCGR_PEP_ID=MMETSP0314-20130426/3972_1 /TAXON_ID=38298 /ORGANISM="Rhodella maculata, Strain CCMP 736" /LENGTH=110 /DNA_ID=CAMNT_0027176357 /DNA_START=70 /DNA_END=402 /DNA_ORIENTATION=+
MSPLTPLTTETPVDLEAGTYTPGDVRVSQPYRPNLTWCFVAAVVPLALVLVTVLAVLGLGGEKSAAMSQKMLTGKVGESVDQVKMMVETLFTRTHIVEARMIIAAPDSLV